VRLKQARLPDGRWRSKPEHDDLAALARQHGLALAELRAMVITALERDQEADPEMDPSPPIAP
jgi:hypothetical protein